MARFLTVANFSVKGWHRGGNNTERGYANREVSICLTNNKNYIRNKYGNYGYPDELGFDYDVTIRVGSVSDEAAQGGCCQCWSGTWSEHLPRAALDYMGPDYDIQKLRAMFKDETAETWELFWELLLQFNEVVFLHHR